MGSGALTAHLVAIRSWHPSNALTEPRMVIRVSLVGTEHVVLDSLRHLIAVEPDLKVLDEAERERPDVALFDLDDPDDDRVFERLERTAKTTRTIVMSISAEPVVAFRVFRCGAMGLVSKRHSPGGLLMAIRKVHAGEVWLGRATATEVLDLARADRSRAGSRLPKPR